MQLLSEGGEVRTPWWLAANCVVVSSELNYTCSKFGETFTSPAFGWFKQRNINCRVRRLHDERQ